MQVMARDERLDQPNGEFVEVTEFRERHLGPITVCCVCIGLCPSSGCTLFFCLCPIDVRSSYRIMRRDELHAWPPPISTDGDGLGGFWRGNDWHDGAWVQLGECFVLSQPTIEQIVAADKRSGFVSDTPDFSVDSDGISYDESGEGRDIVTWMPDRVEIFDEKVETGTFAGAKFYKIRWVHTRTACYLPCLSSQPWVYRTTTVP